MRRKQHLDFFEIFWYGSEAKSISSFQNQDVAAENVLRILVGQYAQLHHADAVKMDLPTIGDEEQDEAIRKLVLAGFVDKLLTVEAEMSGYSKGDILQHLFQIYSNAA